MRHRSRDRGTWHAGHGPGGAQPATTGRTRLPGALAVLALLTLPGALRAQDPVIDSVFPAADTLVIDAEPFDQQSDIDFAYCIKYVNSPIQFVSQKGVIGWRDPASGGAVVRMDSTTSLTTTTDCPQTWQLGALTDTFARGRYRLWYEIQIVDTNNAIHTDSVSVDSVFIFDTSPTLTLTTPTDSVAVTGAPSVPALDASTNLGPSQLVRLIQSFKPEGGGAAAVFRTDTVYTDVNGLATRDAIPLDQGDGEYVITAETDSLPIADNPPEVDSPGRDRIVRRLNQNGPGVAVTLPVQDSTHQQQFEVRGRSQPTARVTIDACDGCDALGDTVIAGPDSAWTFGTVDFPMTGANSIRIIAWDTVAITDSPGIADTADVTFDIQVNRPPTLSVVEPADDTTRVFVGDSVRLQAGVSDPDNDPVTVAWTFTPTDPAFPGTPPDSVVGAAPGFVAFVPADTFTVRVVARDDRGGSSPPAERTVIALAPGPNVDRATPGSEERVDGHDVVYVIRAMLTGDLRADVNGDGAVDETDLALVRAAFGERVTATAASRRDGP